MIRKLTWGASLPNKFSLFLCQLALTKNVILRTLNKLPVVLIGLKKYTKYKMRVAASTHVGESSLSEENDIFVRTPEDGKMISCTFNKKKQMVSHPNYHLPHAAFSG